MTQKNDEYYIDQVLNGHINAFEYLVEAYKQKAYTLALSILKNQFDAEEVAQDAFLKAFKNLSKFKRDATFSTWLYRIVYNTALSKLQKKKLDLQTMDASHENIAGSVSKTGLEVLADNDRKKYVKLVLDKLSDEEALLVNLYYKHDKDMHEIGQITGLSHGNVRVRLSRIRKRMQEILSKLLNGEIKAMV